MELNSTEWLSAQNILIKLVQILTPLANEGKAISVMIKQRFFIPPFLGGKEDCSTAQLLPKLHSMQQQVKKWVDDPGTQATNPAFKQVATNGVSEAKPDRSEAIRTPKDHSQRLGQGEKIDMAKPQPAICHPFEGRISKQASGSFPLNKQARDLIGQVRVAIQTLANSANLIEPKIEPLREIFKRLKPQIDELVEAVAQEGTQSTEKRSSAPPRLPITRPVEAKTIAAIPFVSPPRAVAVERKRKKKALWLKDRKSQKET